MSNRETDKKARPEAMPIWILVILEQQAIRGDVQAALRGAGFLAVIVDDPRLGIEVLRGAPYDAVVADMVALRKADAGGQVSKALTLVLHETRDSPLVLGTSEPQASTDLLDLTDGAALVEQVKSALESARIATVREEARRLRMV